MSCLYRYRHKSIIPVIVAGLMMTSCIDDEPLDCCDRPPPSGAARIAVVTASSDFSASNFEIISTDDYSVRANLIGQLHTDHSVRAFGSDVYILERHNMDNVIKYDARDMIIDYQRSLGVGLNIQDIAVVSETKAYISAYNSSDLIIFDPLSGVRVSSVDLSRYNTFVDTDSAEASPFVSALAVYGDYVYAACQRMRTVQETWGTNIVTGDTSLILVIDTRTDAVVNAIELSKKNPVSMSIQGDRMLVSSAGDWYDVSGGGVEMIDLASNTNMGVTVSADKFGGGVSNVAFVSPNKAYISVGKMSEDFSNYRTEIIPFDPASGIIGTNIDGIGDGFGGIVYDNQMIYAGDRSSGVAVIDPSTDAVVRRIPTGLPPSALAVIFGE